MRPATLNLRVVARAAAAVAVGVAMTACGGSMTPSPLVPTQSTITALPPIDEMLSEKILGSAAAPNTIVEYVSFWNAASASFHLNDVPRLKSELLDSGKAKIVFRSLFVGFELQSATLGSAAPLAYCAGNARFFDAVQTLFTNQNSWRNANNPDQSIQQVMLGFGMSQAVINACTGNSALQTGLINVANNALSTTYLLPDGTQRGPGSIAGAGSIVNLPAVVVNGTLFDGYDAAGTANASFAATFANIQAKLSGSTH